ncbi:DUF4012 domain-containing protein [Candidatus Microgenomates bacterium]|nr:DUF4012 domain-containing protein [Candidatus Microgenomates bacterium]
MAYLKTALLPLSQNLLILALETQNSQIRDFAQTTKLLSSVVTASDTIGGNKKEGRFLVLFLNDKELRPGGGFIGSYGIVTLGHYSVQNIEIHDVYDADGQLKEHVDPPDAVRTYLQNPHWFLRDSNFSADFKENAGRAEWFLERELGAPPFDGIIGITTTTIENIIGAYGSVTLADTGDIITKENFYEKTQAKAQDNFFPGSRQKQTTLSSLSQALMLQLDSVSKEALATVTRRMLREKQMVVYMKDPSIQSILEEYHWAGRIVKTDGDYLYPIEANVGVNKVNSFTKRSTNYEVRIVNSKPVKHIYTTQFDNTYNGSMPENNIYKNYFQLYIPKTALVETVLVDGGRVSYQVWPQNDLIAPTVYVEVPPQSSKKITVIYTTPPLVTSSPSSTYHLSVQKQVGSENSPFVFSISLPKGSSLLSKDFDAEIQGVTLKHQTTLSEDRAFEMTFTSQ